MPEEAAIRGGYRLKKTATIRNHTVARLRGPAVCRRHRSARSGGGASRDASGQERFPRPKRPARHQRAGVQRSAAASRPHRPSMSPRSIATTPASIASPPMRRRRAPTMPVCPGRRRRSRRPSATRPARVSTRSSRSAARYRSGSPATSRRSPTSSARPVRSCRPDLPDGRSVAMNAAPAASLIMSFDRPARCNPYRAGVRLFGTA